MRKKMAMAAGLVLVLALVPFTSGGAQDAQSDVRVVHGIGGGSNPVDVYLGQGADPTEWDLVVADLTFEEFFDAGNVPVGTYNALVCQAVPDPAATVSSCPAGAVNGNFGNPVELTAGPVAVIAAYAGPDEEAPGRPTVISVPVNLECVPNAETARVTAIHAAAAPAVDVLAGEDPVFEDVVFGEGPDTEVPGATYALSVTLTDGTPVLDLGDVDLAGQVNTIAIVVGNPQQEADYSVIPLAQDLEVCQAPTTTTTAAPTTTTTAAPVRPATVAPAFTG